jgi:hypothetical protein
MVETQSSWDETESILTSRLSGAVSVADVEQWKRSLAAAAAAIPPGRSFKRLFDLHGYEPLDLEAHKAMRTVIPMLLASHGMRPAVLDLFDEKPEVLVSVTDGKVCTGFANLHHDAAKMARYEEQLARPDQRFFSDPAAARAWLLSL